MPYITQDRRKKLEPELRKLWKKMILLRLNKPGDVNYVLTKLLVKTCTLETYEDINKAIGILQCMIQEIYRRAAVEYEEYKCHINGDVF